MLQSNFTFKVGLEFRSPMQILKLICLSIGFHLFDNSALAKLYSSILLIPLTLSR